MTRRQPITPEDVLAVIREHGPITKTELGIRLTNNGTNPRLMRLLDQLHEQKRVTLKAGTTKNTATKGWVYEVAPCP